MRKDFREDEKIKRLLWCDRHCCLCEQACGIDIVFAHIDPEGGNDIDNAIPTCYDCHSEIGKYNKEHPLGTKFKIKELKKHREQIYEKYTRHLVPPIQNIISNYMNPYKPVLGKRQYPDITFNITNMSDYLPARLFTTLRGVLNGKRVKLGLSKGHYTGDKAWKLNPMNTINGHFTLGNRRLVNLKPEDKLEIQVKVRLIDMWDREHNLEYAYVYNRRGDYWYFEP
jgi:hypothetical protein